MQMEETSSAELLPGDLAPTEAESVWDSVGAWWKSHLRAGDACVERNARGGFSRSVASRTCRICFEEDVDMMRATRSGLHVCGCRGLSESVHADCLMQWIASSRKLVCELCHQRYRANAWRDASVRERMQQLLDGDLEPSHKEERDDEQEAVHTYVAPTTTATIIVMPSTLLLLPCALLLTVFGSWVQSQLLRRRCRRVASQSDVPPVLRGALLDSATSGFVDVMREALRAAESVGVA